MAVTKQVYTLSPTWTASGLASLFRSAFIDAGLMTEWYDDFLSGSVENRILEVVNDATKTYGTVYYWFMFTTTTVAVHTALSWDATSHVPTGTQYQNYFSTTTNSLTNHNELTTSLVTTTSLTLTRYTSAINTSCTWFFLRQSFALRFLIPFGAYTATSFVDQNVMAFNGFTYTSLTTSSGGNITFTHGGGHTRRTYLGATACIGSTFAQYYDHNVPLTNYSAIGNSNQSAPGNVDNEANIRLPTALTNTHTGLASDYTPVFTSIQYSPYAPVLPADFALCAYYASTSVGSQDTFIVTAGVEEYEVLTVANGSTGSILFLARTVG
jgi:hypothetical protein